MLLAAWPMESDRTECQTTKLSDPATGTMGKPENLWTRNKTQKPGSLERVVRARLDALLIAGQMCSNCCYNIAQKEAMTDRTSTALRESYKATMSKIETQRQSSTAQPGSLQPDGSACPSCCSTQTQPEREDSQMGFLMLCNECGWTWCPTAAEEAKIMADVLYGWAMPNDQAHRPPHTDV